MSDLKQIIHREGLTFVPETQEGEAVFKGKEQEQLNIEAKIILENTNKLIEKEDWTGLKTLVEAMPEDSPIVSQTAFLQELHERLFLFTSKKTDFDNLNDNYVSAYDLAKLIVEKMGQNKFFLQYLKSIVLQDRMPEVASLGAEQKFRYDETGDRKHSWIYYRQVVNSIIKIGDSESIAAIGEILDSINDKIFKNLKADLEDWPYYGDGDAQTFDPEQQKKDDKLNFYRYIEDVDSVKMYPLNWGADDFKRHVLETLGESGNKQAVELILNFLTKEGHASYKFVSEASEAILKLDPDFFNTVSSLLSEKNIQLQDFEKYYNITLLSVYSEKHRAKLFKSLAAKKLLSPVPEIHWRVDRNMEEYGRRLGVNVKSFLQTRVKPEKRQILLEIGPGSGEAKKERFGDLLDGYVDYGLSDKIYYPLAPIFRELLDFRKLEIEEESDKDILADYIYKVLVIKKGQTAQDVFEYDAEVNEELLVDINSLKNLWSVIQDKLEDSHVVPSGISNHVDGKVVYNQKIDINNNPKLVTALKMLKADFKSYLKPRYNEADYFELVPAFPPNVMLGDMQNIDRLAENQIDVELASRATVYARGEAYVDFVKKLEKALATNGTALDDSIRDNDGHYYRIAEVLKAKKNMEPDTEVLVILGKPFEGEDYNQQDLVPLSMVITKRGSSKEQVERSLEGGNRVVTIEDLAKDNQYLRSLDTSGKTLAEIAKIAA
jgi:hypothetical protein